MKKLKLTKSDLWGVIGIILLIIGQFTGKEPFSGFGVTIETNLMEFSGAVLLLFPFAIRGYSLFKGKKESNEDTQS